MPVQSPMIFLISTFFLSSGPVFLWFGEFKYYYVSPPVLSFVLLIISFFQWFSITFSTVLLSSLSIISAQVILSPLFFISSFILFSFSSSLFWSFFVVQWHPLSYRWWLLWISFSDANFFSTPCIFFNTFIFSYCFLGFEFAGFIVSRYIFCIFAG